MRVVAMIQHSRHKRATEGEKGAGAVSRHPLPGENLSTESHINPFSGWCPSLKVTPLHHHYIAEWNPHVITVGNKPRSNGATHLCSQSQGTERSSGAEKQLARFYLLQEESVPQSWIYGYYSRWILAVSSCLDFHRLTCLNWLARYLPPTLPTDIPRTLSHSLSDSALC